MGVWHIETDLVALAIFVLLLVKTSVLHRGKTLADRMFCLPLALGVACTLVDIVFSVGMNSGMGRRLYEISMIVCGLFAPVPALSWLLYSAFLLFQEQKTNVRRAASAFAALYVLYAAVIATNPIHGRYFSLTPELACSPGPWYPALLAGIPAFLSALGILLLLLKWKRLLDDPLLFLLPFFHVVTAASCFAQLAMPDRRMVCSAYAVAFLICDAAFETRRRGALYDAAAQSLEQLQEEKTREKLYQAQLEETLQAAKRSNQARSEFLSRMSHDIRTPINGILGLLNIIRKERDHPERVDDCLSKIEAASGNLLAMVNDVLDMSKMERGEIRLAQEAFDLRAVTMDCIRLMSQAAAEKGVELAADDVGKTMSRCDLVGSPQHLRRVLINLMDNAIRFNHVGGYVICTSEEVECTEERIVCRFIIRDTGAGISAEFLPQLFQPFTQEHRNPGDTGEGAGLGLAVVKQIVDLMGGEIRAESKVDEGSTFTLTLPFALNRNTRREDGALRDAPDDDSLRDMMILLVEDNELNLEIAQFMLKDAGAAVDVAVNGQEAVDLFAMSPERMYDAILMDVTMPGIDGLEAARRIRAMKREDAGSVPIIAMTANAFAEDVEKCMAAGMNEHIAKPLDQTLMLRILTNYIKKTR